LESPLVLFHGVALLFKDDLVNAVGKTGKFELAFFVCLDEIAAAGVEVPEIDFDPLKRIFLRVDDSTKKIILTVLAGPGKNQDQAH
jgi:hypothetical protein